MVFDYNSFPLSFVWFSTPSYEQLPPTSCPIHRRRRSDSTDELSRVGGVYTQFATIGGDSFDESEQICQQRIGVASCRRYKHTRRQSWPSLQFPVLLSYWGWWQDDIMTSLLNKLSISIKIHVVKPLWSLVSFQIVDRILRQSSWDSCELCSHRRRRRDSSRRLRRVGGEY